MGCEELCSAPGVCGLRRAVFCPRGMRAAKSCVLPPGYAGCEELCSVPGVCGPRRAVFCPRGMRATKSCVPPAGYAAGAEHHKRKLRLGGFISLFNFEHRYASVLENELFQMKMKELEVCEDVLAMNKYIIRRPHP